MAQTKMQVGFIESLTASLAELNILDGVTSNATELNLLDNVSGLVQADLTKLAEITVTSAEVNFLSSIGSNVKTQIDAKAPLAGPTFTGTTTFATLSDGTIAVTAWVDEDNMASNSATLIPTQQSIKAYADTKAPIATPTFTTSITIGSATISEAELEILDGATVTTTELNLLDALDRGSILYGNASGVTTVLGQGSADQVLTSDGTDISWEDAGGGGEDISVKTNDASTQSFTSGSMTAVAFDEEDFDTDTMHNTASYNNRITIKTAGKYLIGFSVGLGNNSSGRRAFIIVLNGATTLLDVETGTNTSQAHFDSGSMLVDLDVDDWFDLTILQTSGSSLSTINGAGSPTLWAVKMPG